MDLNLQADAASLAGLLLAGAAYLNLFAAVLVCTSRDATLLRLTAAAPLAALTRCVHIFGNAFLTPLQQRVFAPMLWHSYLSLIELLLLTRADTSDLPAGGGSSSWWQALCVACNPRRIGTKWEVKGVRRRKASRKGEESRLRFVLRSLVTALIACTIVDVVTTVPPKPEPHLIEVGKDTLYAFWNLSAEDVIVRLVTVLMFGLITCLCVVFMYYAMAAFTVAMGLSKVEAWPPVFGSLSSAYTLRGLWSSCWHQLLRKVVASYGDFTSDKILGLPRGSFPSRFTRLFLAFFISGMLHYAMELQNGIAEAPSGVLYFFLLQPLGIVVEQVVQAAMGETLPRPMRRVIGYVWVVAWFWWSMPVFCYEQTRMGHEPDLSPIPVARLARHLLESAK